MNPLDIHYSVYENDLRKVIDINFIHTSHSNKRSSQRGVNNDKIIIALEYGKTTFKQGLLYYVLGEKDIPVQKIPNLSLLWHSARFVLAQWFGPVMPSSVRLITT